MTALDLDFVRSQFPAFSSPVLSTHAFFENAGGSYPCAAVVDRLHRFYTDRKVQPYAPYPGAQAGGAELIRIPAAILAGIRAQSDKVIRGSGASLAWPGLLRRLARENPGYDT